MANGGAAVDGAWVSFCQAAEAEACEICQVPADLEKHSGRHEAVKTKTVREYPCVPSAFPRTSRVGDFWRGIADLLKLAACWEKPGCRQEGLGD